MVPGYGKTDLPALSHQLEDAPLLQVVNLRLPLGYPGLPFSGGACLAWEPSGHLVLPSSTITADVAPEHWDVPEPSLEVALEEVEVGPKPFVLVQPDK